MVREVKMKDGRTLLVEADRPLTQAENTIAAIRYHDGQAADLRRRAGEQVQVAKDNREYLARLMARAGVGYLWHDGTLYRRDGDGVTEFDCPRACDVAANPEPSGDTADEEARGGGMPGEPEAFAPSDAKWSRPIPMPLPTASVSIPVAAGRTA